MKSILKYLKRFLTWSSQAAGHPLTFLMAWVFVMIWVVLGVFWGFSVTWILFLDTVATLNASLMVFIIQSTQVRENKALHLKIDGLIKSIKEAENELIAIESAEEEQLEKIRKKIHDFS